MLSLQEVYGPAESSSTKIILILIHLIKFPMNVFMILVEKMFMICLLWGGSTLKLNGASYQLLDKII